MPMETIGQRLTATSHGNGKQYIADANGLWIRDCTLDVELIRVRGWMRTQNSKFHTSLLHISLLTAAHSTYLNLIKGTFPADMHGLNQA